MTKKLLVVQLQLAQLDADVCEHAIRTLDTLGRDGSLVSSARLFRGEEEGGYINVEFETCDAVHLWNEIKARLLGQSSGTSGVARGVIVVCQGNCGWDDYLLLFHNDPSVQCDRVD